MPTEALISASREVVDGYRRNNSGLAGTIKWAEFEFGGGLLRCGVSQVTTMSTRLISNWRDDPDIAEIVSLAETEPLRAGQMLPIVGRKSCYWFVPYTPTDQNEVQKTRLKVLVITQELVIKIIEMFNAHAGLTSAETKMIYQIIIGLSPADAAKIDNVSAETKRAHLKNACAKLDCVKQSEIMRLVLSQMIHILYMCEAETSHMHIVEKFTSEHLGDVARLSVQRLFNGRLMRFWEVGPPEGKPLLMIHGCLFPFMLLNAKAHLERHGIRLVIPVRSGYLDGYSESDAFYDSELLDQTVEDLLQFVQQTWHSPVPMIGHATGGFFAMMMAAANPKLFDKVLISSINLFTLGDDKNSYSSNFFTGFRKLVNDASIYEPIARQFQKTIFSSRKTTKFVLRRLFKGCASDVAVADGQTGFGHCYDWYMQLHKNSPLGISSDFMLMSSGGKDIAKKVRSAVSFVHGPDDGFTTLEQMKDFVASNPLLELRPLSEGGHLVSASHPHLLWDAVADSLKPTAVPPPS